MSRNHSSVSSFFRLLSVGVVLALLLLLTSGRSEVGAQDSKKEDLAPLIKKLQALADPKKLPERLDLLEKLAKQESTAAFDVKAKAKELGSEIDKIFSFVRDEVRYEAYEGVLRGPRGTLMALAGNSLDKSLLLAELLKENGVPVRFVRGRLSPEQAQSLITHMFEAVKRDEKPATRKKEEPTAYSKEIDEATDAFVHLNIARWLSSIETVGNALRRAKIGVADQPPVPSKALLAEAQDHLWIEVKQGETWTALDPSFKDAKAGKTFTKGESVQSVPVTAHHRVSIRLRLEERVADGVKTRDVLQHEATAAELNGAAVSLRHAISSTKTDWTATPVLRIEDNEIRGQKISGSAGLAEGVTQLAKGLFKRPEGKAVEQSMTAMWLDFEFIYPSGKKEVVRREVFDRLGLVARSEKRESSAPLAPLPSFGMPYPLAGAFALSFSSGTLHPGLAQRQLVRQVPLLRKALAKPSAPGTTQQLTGEEKQRLLTEPLSLMAMSSHLSSQANIRLARLAGVWGNVWFYEATPRVAVVSAVPAGGKAPNVEISLDLRRNDLRVVGNGVPSPEIVWANITRGLLDGALEHVLFVDSASANPTASTPLSTIAVFERARQAGLELGTVTDRKSLGSLVVPAEAKARLSASLHEKVALITPTKAVRLGSAERLAWWQVDRQTGETLGIMDNGLHGGAAEALGILVDAVVVVASVGGTFVMVAWFYGEIVEQRAYREGWLAGHKQASDYARKYGPPPPESQGPGQVK